MSEESRCFTVGIRGYCGPECPVYLEGDCSEHQALIDRLTPEELEKHKELYPDKRWPTEGGRENYDK